MPRITSTASAPTAAHKFAIAFTKETLAARKALQAYLMVSADAGSVIITGAPSGSYSAASLPAAVGSSLPMTTRSGCNQSCTALPSLRNSGLETTAVSGRPRASTTAPAEPTGTVDLVTTTATA